MLKLPHFDRVLISALSVIGGLIGWLRPGFCYGSFHYDTSIVLYNTQQLGPCFAFVRAAPGREAVQEFLTRKWSKEQGYRLKKHLWSFEVTRIIY